MAGLSGLSFLGSSGRQNVLLCGAAVFDDRVVLAVSDFAEYDGSGHLTIRLATDGPDIPTVRDGDAL